MRPGPQLPTLSSHPRDLCRDLFGEPPELSLGRRFSTWEKQIIYPASERVLCQRMASAAPAEESEPGGRALAKRWRGPGTRILPAPMDLLLLNLC